jgi:hypothetical protein
LSKCSERGLVHRPEHSGLHREVAIKLRRLSLAGLTGPAIGRDGTAYVVTGSGPADPAAGVYANSVVALTAKDLKVKDWYTPSGSGKDSDASPVVYLQG